jgi:hypothetical protein
MDRCKNEDEWWLNEQTYILNYQKRQLGSQLIHLNRKQPQKTWLVKEVSQCQMLQITLPKSEK